MDDSVRLHSLSRDAAKEGPKPEELRYKPAHELQDGGGAVIYDYNKHRKGELDSSLAALPPQELQAEVRL